MHLKTLLKRPAITAREAMPIATACEIMRRHGIRHLPVLRGGALVGILTERDVLRSGPSSVPDIRAHDLAYLMGSLTVADVMTRDPVAVPLEASVGYAPRLGRAGPLAGAVAKDGGQVGAGADL